MKTELKKGKALVLVGGPGSGKTMMAREISIKNKNGGTRFKIIGINDLLKGRFALGEVLKGSPDVVIVEQFIPTEENFNLMKPLISNDSIQIERKGEDPHMIPTPHFILCTTEMFSKIGDRRYNIVNLDQPVTDDTEETNLTKRLANAEIMIVALSNKLMTLLSDQDKQTMTNMLGDFLIKGKELDGFKEPLLQGVELNLCDKCIYDVAYCSSFDVEYGNGGQVIECTMYSTKNTNI